MRNKYSVILKVLLAFFVLTVWVNNGFPAGEEKSVSSPARDTIVPEYSYGLGYIPLAGKVDSSPLISSTYTAPSSWDWRSATYDSVTGDWTTIAKSQGGCGSCWDFAAHGALEAIINVRSNNPNLDLDLSEQYILSCYSGGWGCSGSNAYYAYEYMYDHGGAVPETCFPYSADDDIPCSDKCANWQDLFVPISYYGYSSSPSINAIKDYIYEYGPLCLAFSVYADFYTGSSSFDENGVYQYDGVSELRGGHQIVAIGYEDTPGNPNYDGYWICKNSWGATWGPWGDGCFGIAYGECDIEQEAVYVDCDPLNGPFFVRGDYDANGDLTMADALGLLAWIYHQPGGVAPACEDAADYDDNGEIVMADALSLLLFKYHQPGGVAPSPPYPDCGIDPPGDELGCNSYSPCAGGGESSVPSTPISVEDAPNLVKVGESHLEDGLVVVPVGLTNEAELRGFDFTLNYDPAVVTAVKVEDGGDCDFFAPWIDNNKGKVTVGCIPDLSLRRPFTPGQRVVARISLRNKSDASLELSDVALYGLKAQLVDALWVDGIAKTGAGLPNEFALSQNYPNPFNATTVIRYSLPVDRSSRTTLKSLEEGSSRARATSPIHVRLEVFNILGQKVKTLVDGKQTPGYKSVSWSAQDMASGVYFYKLTAGDFASIRKMILLK